METKPVNQQSKAVQARWAGEQANEAEVRELFQTINVDKGLNLLAKMRLNCTLAGTILNDRINQPELQKCKTCEISEADYKAKHGNKDWFLNRPYYDKEDRNIIHVDHFCSLSCISLENQKSQGTKGVSDRGMLRGDNPHNHPNA